MSRVLTGLMNLINEDRLTKIISIMPIIFVCVKLHFNNKYCENVENKFAIPKEYISFDFENVILDITKYILLIVGLDILIWLQINTSTDFKEFTMLMRLMVFYSLFLYVGGTYGIISEKIGIKLKTCFGYICIFILIPFFIELLLYCDKYKSIILLIMIVLTLIFIFIYIISCLNFKSHKYEIIEYKGKKYAIFPKSTKDCFIFVEVKQVDKGYKVVQKGEYEFVEKVSKEGIKRGKIVE